MTSEEAREKLIKQATEDVFELRDLMEVYRIDKGIPLGQFIELMSSVAQEYRLMRQYLTGSTG